MRILTHIIPLFLVLTSVLSCTNDKGSTPQENTSEVVDEVNSDLDDHQGTWKSTDTDEDAALTEGVMNPYESNTQHWVISDDSIKIYEYPFHYLGSFHYRIIENKLYYTIDYMDEKLERSIELNSDSLKVISVPEKEGSEKIVTYYERDKMDEKILDQLEKDMVDWSKFASEWEYYSAYAVSTGFFVAGHLDFDIPEDIDLTKTNEANFKTDRKKLEYSIGEVVYTLSFLSHKAEGNEVVNMTLLITSPAGEDFALNYRKAG
jgi:hypothetical protein